MLGVHPPPPRGARAGAASIAPSAAMRVPAMPACLRLGAGRVPPPQLLIITRQICSGFNKGAEIRSLLAGRAAPWCRWMRVGAGHMAGGGQCASLSVPAVNSWVPSAQPNPTELGGGLFRQPALPCSPPAASGSGRMLGAGARVGAEDVAAVTKAWCPPRGYAWGPQGHEGGILWAALGCPGEAEAPSRGLKAGHGPEVLPWHKTPVPRLQPPR